MNDTRYGLTASVWTRDRERADRFAPELRAGTVYQNRCDYLDPALPWTGVGDSGKGSTLSPLRLPPPDAQAQHQLPRPPVSAPTGDGILDELQEAGDEARQARHGGHRRRPARQVPRHGQVRVASARAPPGSATASSAGTPRTSSTTTRPFPAGTRASPTRPTASTSPPLRWLPDEEDTPFFLAELVPPEGERVPSDLPAQHAQERAGRGRGARLRGAPRVRIRVLRLQRDAGVRAREGLPQPAPAHARACSATRCCARP